MSDSITFNEDCLAGMKRYPDGFFSLAVVDPPYGGGFADSGGCKGWFAKYHQNADSSQSLNVEREREREADGRPAYNRFGSPGSIFERYKREEQDGKKIIAWDAAPGEEYFKELFRVSRNQIIWGGNYFDLPPTRCFLVWRKLTISENFSMAMAEYAWTSFNSNAKVFECAPQGKAGDTRFHPCLPDGTEVFFNGVWKPIEQVEIGDRNIFGVVSDISTHDAEILYQISAGSEKVTATWNHPFLIVRGGSIFWANAEHIREGDEILRTRSALTHSQKKGMLDTEKMGSDFGWSIALFGRNILAQFQTVCKSITKISTRRTIALKISSLSHHLNTNGFTKVADISTAFGISRVKYAENSKRPRQKIGTIGADGLTEKSARNALSKKSLRTVVCECQRVGSVRAIREKTKVYNLTLDGIPAFETKCGITHNTQKPVELYAWVYKLFAKPGDKILDTHMGSQSSRIAAWDAGLDYVGFEIDKTYFDLGEARFQKHTAQTNLFLMEQDTLF